MSASLHPRSRDGGMGDCIIIKGAMEFPILNELQLPETCIKLISQFAREPHPTALLMRSMQFQRLRAGYNQNLGCHYPACLNVRGSLKRGFNPFKLDFMKFEYDRLTGELHIDENDDGPGC